MKSHSNAIEEFVKTQKTIALAELGEVNAEPAVSPYASHWFRGVAAMLRSGRVAVKADGSPNRTDINRICKEANFNQHFFERIANFLIAAKVVQSDRRDRFIEGVNHAAFWKHHCQDVTALARAAVLELLQHQTGFHVWRPTFAMHSGLIEFLILFFAAFEGRALREEHLGNVMLSFARLPEPDLQRLAESTGVKKEAVSFSSWQQWLDAKGQQALLSALYTAEWAYYVEQEKIGWIAPSPIGLAILGRSAMLEMPPLSKEFKADSNLAIYAGAGLDFDVLVPLFRFCKIKRLGQFIEFQVDPKRLKELPSAGIQLRALLKGLEPLPPTMVAALQTESPLGGRIGIRYCSALVKPETAAALAAIRDHPQLKGYVEPGAPPGFLLIKLHSDPQRFVLRCKALGFEIESL